MSLLYSPILFFTLFIGVVFMAFTPIAILFIISESLMHPFIINPDQPLSHAILAKLSTGRAH